MGIIDKLDNFDLLRRRKSVFSKLNVLEGRSTSKTKGCMPTSEKMKEIYTPAVTHLKSK